MVLRFFHKCNTTKHEASNCEGFRAKLREWITLQSSVNIKADCFIINTEGERGILFIFEVAFTL